MFGFAILATLLVGGAIIALDDDDDTSVAPEEPTEPDLREDDNVPTSGGDLLSFGSEDDLVEARQGDDEVRAGGGDDTVLGGLGADTLFGQGGNDDLRGGVADDNLFGAGGEDTLSGDGGQDALIASAGDDVIFSGEGSDFAVGGSGADSIFGGAGNDILYGGEYDSEPTDDDIEALRTDVDSFGLIETNDNAADTLNGGDGVDALILDDGDIGRGGADSDLFMLLADEENDDAITITDYADGEDQILVAIRGEDSGLEQDDFTVVNDEDTGDALVMQGTEVLARVEDAGETLTVEDLAFSVIAPDPSAA